MVRKASCCCGQSAVVVNGDPEFNGICHCDECKKSTGSAFGWSAYFENSQVIEILGEQDVYRLGSPFDQERHRCSHCGTMLYWTNGEMKGMTGVAGGCFVEIPLDEPKATYSDANRHNWVTLSDGCEVRS